jgi:predicted transcriptional regulator
MYDSYIMKRTQIYLEADQDRRLAKRATATGTTKSNLIREAIDAYLASSASDAARLAQFRAALDEVASAPVTLPDGRSYVERMRAGDEQRQRSIERRRR